MNPIPETVLENVRQKWETFLAAAEKARVSPPDNPEVVSEIHRIWAFSEFVSKSCIQEPDLLNSLFGSGDLKRRLGKEHHKDRAKRALSGVQDEPELSRAVRRFRRREMVRIAWRDLAGTADLFETMADLTAFADCCVAEVLSLLYQWQSDHYGVPFSRDGKQQRLVVIGMGKLGGMELNFSSDVDLIFAFPDHGRTEGGETVILNEDFFVRLCRKLIKVLGETTVEGLLFRVDMRLRPAGESGPVVMGFDNLVDYYERQGREWERYAWIKARVVAGDPVAGKRLLDRLGPFIYRRYLDYGAFESLREMKQMISREVRRKGLKHNIKLGAGGIREVEFFGQIFQLIRGGVLPVLQEQGILQVLKILAGNNLVPQEVCAELEDAYRFLRVTENRLQEFSDRQTHAVPTDPDEGLRLAVSLGFSDFDAFNDRLSHCMERVHYHFEKLLEPQDSKETEKTTREELDDLKGIWMQSSDKEKERQTLVSAGFDDPDEIIRLLAGLREHPAVRSHGKEGKERLDKLIPRVLKEVGSAEYPLQSLNRILDLIRTIGGRANYLALLLENPGALVQLITLADASPWVVTFLTRHPVLLDELLDPRTLYVPPQRDELIAELEKKRAYFSDQDLEYQIEELCIYKQVNTLRISAADVAGVLPLMKVSDHLSYIAETILDQVLDLAWEHLVQRHGEPACASGDDGSKRGFAVIAFGKLGGLELGYDSDLDLVFLHTGSDGHTKGGKHPIDDAQFFARLGQRVIHILTAHTPAGFLYETDMRLRPSGGSGPLVSHINGYKSYQLESAWTWEHQALVKARAVCGDGELMNRFEALRRDVLCQPRDPEVLKKDVSRMRERMRKELATNQSGKFDLKQDPGAMVDIEFLVQYLLLLHAHRYAELTTWTDNVRILGTLAKNDILDAETAYLLREAYLVFRSALHKLSLQEKSAVVSDDRFKTLRDIVCDTWNCHLGTGEVGAERK